MRLQINFELHNLFFDGGKVPANPKALKNAISDLVETCRAQGAEIITIPTKPVSFSQLVGDLEALGLLSVGDTDPAPAPAVLPRDDPLVVAHQAQIKKHMQNEARSDVSSPSQPDLLAPVVTESFGEDVDLSNIEIIIDTGDTVVTHTTLAPPSLSPSLPPPGPGTTQPQASAGCPDSEACNILRSQTVDSSSPKCARCAAPQSTRASRIQTLEMGFCSKVGLEMRSEITRHTEVLMDQIQTLPAIKNLAEDNHSEINNLSESVTEIARTIGSSRSQMLTALKGVSNGPPPQAQHELLSEIRTKLSANSALLKEAIKTKAAERSGFETPIKNTLSTPLTPLTHSKPKKCYDCSGDHLRINCPDKLSFCARCTSRSHKTYTCPSIRSQCSICKDAGRGELAYGHTKAVHQETDREKREKITQFTAKSCFPDWVDQEKKRKTPPM